MNQTSIDHRQFNYSGSRNTTTLNGHRTSLANSSICNKILIEDFSF